MTTVNLNKAAFLKKIFDFESNPGERRYLGDKPAVIDFYASWCGPCKALAPVLEELAQEYKDQIYVYKIDIDSEHELSALFKIRSVPSLLFIPLEGAPRMMYGVAPKATLEDAINNVLLKK